MKSLTKFQKRKSRSIEDPFLSYIKGFSGLDNLVRDITDLHKETFYIRNSLFPLQRSSRSVASNTEATFYVECEDSVVKNDLSSYLFDKYSRYRDSLYGNGDDLGSFFGTYASELMIKGIFFSEVVWDSIDIDGRTYILPVDFSYIHPSTMGFVRKNSKIVGYKQVYSIITSFLRRKDYSYKDLIKNRKVTFSTDEIFYGCYPFSLHSPTRESKKLLKAANRFMEFSLDTATAGAYPENHQLNIERAKYKSVKLEKVKATVARSKIRKIFNYIPEAGELKITEYYDIFTVIRYRKFLNKMRDYMISEFNKQVISEILRKNNLSVKATLKYKGFLNNIEINKAFDAYKNGSLSSQDLIKEIVEKP
ncbi:MAG: hypothetical protein ACSLEX_01405 [Minisyncoccota bacterium]